MKICAVTEGHPVAHVILPFKANALCGNFIGQTYVGYEHGGTRLPQPAYNATPCIDCELMIDRMTERQI